MFKQPERGEVRTKSVMWEYMCQSRVQPQFTDAGDSEQALATGHQGEPCDRVPFVSEEQPCWRRYSVTMANNTPIKRQWKHTHVRAHTRTQARTSAPHIRARWVESEVELRRAIVLSFLAKQIQTAVVMVWLEMRRRQERAACC